MTTTGVHPASMIMRARVLLALDTSAGEVDTKEVIAGLNGSLNDQKEPGIAADVHGARTLTAEWAAG